LSLYYNIYANIIILLRPWMLKNQLMWPINIIDRPRLEIRRGMLAVWSSDERAARLPGQREFGGELRENVFEKGERNYYWIVQDILVISCIKLKFLFLKSASFISRECACCFGWKLVLTNATIYIYTYTEHIFHWLVQKKYYEFTRS